MNRAVLFTGGVAAILAAVAACGTHTTTTIEVCPDAGAPETGPVEVPDATPDVVLGTPLPDAGVDSSLYGPTTTTFRKLGADDAYKLVGVTSGAAPHVIYYVQTTTDFALMAVPVAGGAAITLDPDVDPFGAGYFPAVVSGGAVGWSSTTDNNIGDEVNVWTAENGVKTVTTTTDLGQFWATDDGTYVAFSANAVAGTSTDIVVTTSAAPSIASPALTGANAENLSINTDACPVKFGFAGTTFIGSYCTGTTIASSQEQLVTVDATSQAAYVRIDNSTTDNAYIGDSWLTDAQGKNFFVIDQFTNGRVVATDGATTTTAPLGSVAKDAMVVPDGSGVVFRDSTSILKRATFAATPVVTQLAPKSAGILAITKDSKTALFQTTNTDGLGDIQAVDLGAPTPRAIVTESSILLGLTGDQSRIVYVTADPDGSAALHSIALAGGNPIFLNAIIDTALLPQVGTGVVVLFGETPILHSSTQSKISISYIDAAKGGLLEAPVETVLDASDSFAFSGKTFIYRDVGSTPGIYALDLP